MKQLNIIEEGGAAGHLQHLYDNRELTFAELKDVIKSAAEAKLECWRTQQSNQRALGKL